MPRSASGVYTLPVPPFIPNTVIRSADVNSDFSDVATALTQSLATTGVSSMVGQFKAASGSQLVPSISFAAATGTGFWLSGTNEVSYATPNGIVVVLGASLTVTWGGSVFYSGNMAVLGSLDVSGSTTLGSDLSVAGTANLAGTNVVVATTSVNIAKKISLLKITDPTSAAANNAFIYVKSDGPNNYAAPYTENESGEISPLLFTGGQCQLTKVGTSLVLLPFGGNRLTVNGIPCIVPAAGVSLAASNSAGVFVYIYAAATSGVITSIELSTTVPIAQATTGIKQKTGDSTRTLVGAAYTDAGGAWADTDGKLWVISYFNRRQKASRTQLTVSVTTATVAYFELDTAMRNQFISWNDEIISMNSKMYVLSPSTCISASGIYIDGTNYTGGGLRALFTNVGDMVNNYTTVSGLVEATTHYANVFGGNLNGTSTTYSNNTSTTLLGTQMYITVRG